MSKIRVLIAEDHETVRHGLRLLIDGQRDMQVVAEAGDGREALAQAMTLDPDVALIDLSMPNVNGLQATRAIRTSAPRTAVVALTRYGDHPYVQELLRAGAIGYVLKKSASSDLLDAIRAAASGHGYVDASLGSTAPPAFGGGRPRGESIPRISDREREVLRLMALGHSNKEIAADLGISVKTVEVHKSNAMRKLDLHGRVDVVRFALLQGWLSQP
jgi:DNA-binding NarL/FixJ family response regulator